MKDSIMSRSKGELAAAAEASMKELDAIFREASGIVGDELDKEGQRNFRQLRRKWARFHADAGDFIDDNQPEIVILAGGT